LKSKESIPRLRSSLLRAIREFFHTEGFIEVDTPALAPSIIPEPTIDVFTTNRGSDDESVDRKRANELYLLPSPEKWLKRIICAGESRVYQLAHAYRRNEPASGLHASEFMLLEWYAIESDYMDEMARTVRLLRFLGGDEQASAAKPIQMTIAESFLRFADIDLVGCSNLESFRSCLDARDINYTDSEDWSDLFHRILIDYVEPAIRSEPLVVLVDYPYEVKCLAKRKPGTIWRERWELYMNGVEIANCYSEETDTEELSTLFRSESLLFRGRTEPIDTDFITIHAQAPDAYSGVALGFDRLLMNISGTKRIEDVAYFADEIDSAGR
jgi:elongation factor P--(R)-beta-lysine ligase